MCDSELRFIGLNLDYKDCLRDTYHSALTILLRGENEDKDYVHYVEGIRKIRGHIYGENFSSEVARLYACKVMLIAACLYRDISPKDVAFGNEDLPKTVQIKRIRSLSKAEKTKRFFELAVAAMRLMDE